MRCLAGAGQARVPIGRSVWHPSGEPDPERPPKPPPCLNQIAHNPLFAEYVSDARVLAVARAMLDPHLRIAQTEVFKDAVTSPPSQHPSTHVLRLPFCSRRLIAIWRSRPQRL